MPHKDDKLCHIHDVDAPPELNEGESSMNDLGAVSELDDPSEGNSSVE